mgnify:CR=1 FL=1
MDKMKAILKQVEEVQFAINSNVTNEQMYEKLNALLEEVWDILYYGISNSE